MELTTVVIEVSAANFSLQLQDHSSDSMLPSDELRSPLRASHEIGLLLIETGGFDGGIGVHSWRTLLRAGSIERRAGDSVLRSSDSDARVPRPSVQYVPLVTAIIELIRNDDALQILHAFVAHLSFHPQSHRRPVRDGKIPSIHAVG